MNVSELSGLIKNFTQIDETTSKVSIYICYPGQNVNGSSISKEVLTKMSDTLLGCALVGKIENGNFTDHAEVLHRKNGNWEIDYETQPYGFVDKDPSLANIRWETINNKEYLTCDAFLWTGRYPELIEIFKNNEVQQSMEIWIKKGDVKDEIFHIYDAAFLGLCMLGTAPPAFEDAKVQMYTAVPDAFLYMVAQYKKSFKKEDADLEVFNHEEYAQKTYSMTANQIRGLLQNAISAKYADMDWEQRYSVEDWDSSHVYTVNWYSEDRIAYAYKIENGEAIVDFENPLKYINGPQIVSEVPEGHQPSVFESVKSCFTELKTKAENYDQLKSDFDAKQTELTNAQDELRDVKEKSAKFQKEYFEMKAQEKYESDKMIKAAIQRNEFEDLLSEFTEKNDFDLNLFGDRLDLLMARNIKKDPSILHKSDDGLNYMDAFSRQDIGDEDKSIINKHSPYPGRNSKED